VQLLDRFVHAGDVLEADITFEPPPWTWFIRKIQNAIRITNGSSAVSSDHHGELPVPLESNFTSSARSARSKLYCDSSVG
jgi:hypothetical protein